MGAHRRVIAVSMAAGAAMLLCFAGRSTAMTAPRALPYDPPALSRPAEEGAVDLNTATLEELMSLSGIGEVRARAILDDRARNGPYRYPEELIRVRGIGEGILEEILDRVTTGGDGYAENSGG